MTTVPEIDYAQIHADVAVICADPADRTPEAPHKVRLVIFSGPDFRTPHISRGAILSDRGAAQAKADELLAACDVLGIPVRNHVPERDALPERGEFDA